MSDLVLIEPAEAVIATDDGPLQVQEIALGGTPRGLVVLLHETATPAVDVVEGLNHLAGEGYESMALVGGADRLSDVFRRAAERGWAPEQIGMVGLGAGGTAVLEAARQVAFGAAVSFSASPDLEEVRAQPSLQTPWLGLFGAASGDLRVAEQRALADLLRAGSDVYSEVVVYDGVGRDFHRSAGSGVSYAASYDSWQRTTEWLNARVAARLTPLAAAWRAKVSSAQV